MINELQDAPYDVHHPTKFARPVPSGEVNIPLAYAQWILLALVGLGVAALVSWPLVLTLAGLWLMGCVYNIPPVRTKDRPYLDVLSESVNNPLRLLAGWYMVTAAGVPPLSALISYWMIGCYFMAIKRYAEYRDLREVPGREARYRKSFAYYTEERLLVSIIFYASAAMLFLGAYLVRYRLELVLAFPVLAICMAIYLQLAFQPNSPAENPEKLYRQPALMISVAVCAAAHDRAAVRRHSRPARPVRTVVRVQRVMVGAPRSVPPGKTSWIRYWRSMNSLRTAFGVCGSRCLE